MISFVRLIPPLPRTSAIILAIASAAFLQACDEEGACVTTNADGMSYCFEQDYCYDTHYPGSSCADVGYPYWCEPEDMLNSGSSKYGLARYLNNAACNPEAGPGGGGNCESSCPSEFSDVQLDSFCRAACCHAVTGFRDRAQVTCQAGAELGTSMCRYCK